MTCPECKKPLHDYDVTNSIVTCKAGHRWTREDIPEGVQLTPVTPTQVIVARRVPMWLPGAVLGGIALLVELIARLG